MTLATDIIDYLKSNGASLVGFADLSVLDASARHNLPRAVGFAVALTPEIIAGIAQGPTREYHAEYQRVNALLDELSRLTADFLRGRGFTAISAAATHAGVDPATLATELPQKTIGTLAGFGWIGKCALLVNEQFGSAIRLNRVLTDAPLPTANPIVASRCGDCNVCVDSCPGKAATGDNWQRDKHRDAFFDVFACRRAAREIAQQRIGADYTVCGLCIAVCPWTQKYIKQSLPLSGANNARNGVGYDEHSAA